MRAHLPVDWTLVCAGGGRGGGGGQGNGVQAKGHVYSFPLCIYIYIYTDVESTWILTVALGRKEKGY